MIEPQLAMKIVGNFDRVFMDVISEKVRTKLSFKVGGLYPTGCGHGSYGKQGSLDTYRFCDDVWTFLIKDVNFKLDDNKTMIRSDKVKIVSMTNKKATEAAGG